MQDKGGAGQVHDKCRTEAVQDKYRTSAGQGGAGQVQDKCWTKAVQDKAYILFPFM